MAKRPPNIGRLTRRRRVDGLIAALGYYDWVTDQRGDPVDVGIETRRDAILALGLFNDVRAIDAVIQMAFVDEAEEVLEATASSLVSLLQRAEGDPEYRAEVSHDGGDPDGDAGAVQLARTLLLTADEERLEANRDLLTRVLGGGSSSALSEVIVDEMLGALDNPRPQIVERAERMLVAHGGDNLEPIMAAVEDPARAAPAALVLGQLHDNRALPVLADGLSSTDPLVRRACAWAVGELADSRGVAELFSATTDPNYDVRREAFAALDKLGSIGVIGGMATALFSRGIALPAGGDWTHRLHGEPAQELTAHTGGEDASLVGSYEADAQAGATFVENLAADAGAGTSPGAEPAALPRGEELTITAIDGTVLHAEVFGPPDAPAIVLAHGWGLSRRLWSQQIAALSGESRVIAFDLRGHGRSEPARGGEYGFDVFGEDLEAVLAATLGDRPAAVIAGHSLGATSVAAWARRRDASRRTNAVCLLNLGTGSLVFERLLLRIMPVGIDNVSGASDGFSQVHHAVIRYVAFGSATPELVSFYEEMLTECQPDVRRACMEAIADQAIHEGLRALTVPTVVISGAVDRLAPPDEASAIANSLPSLRETVKLPETGHMSPLEQPHEVSLRLRELASQASHDPRS
jgi:pimeloyl-ACP methyl ester carboxylesterase/HEAT repeat protein